MYSSALLARNAAVSISEMRKSLAMPRTSALSVATQEAASSATGSGSTSAAGAGAGSASYSLGALLQGFEKSLLEELKQHLALLQARLAQ